MVYSARSFKCKIVMYDFKQKAGVKKITCPGAWDKKNFN